jgi:hypothetical protein
MLSRRHFLATTAALAMLPRRARAAGTERCFLFVFAQGGWDTTRVFTPAFGNTNVDMEADAALATVGDLPYVDHPRRPSVRAFFETYADRIALVNGMLVPSIAHERCRALALTGGTDVSQADWGARIGGASERPLPYLVLGGPSFSGADQEGSARAGDNGQLAALLSGDAIGGAVPSAATESAIDAFVTRRASLLAATARGDVARGLTSDFATATRQVQALKGRAESLRFGEVESFAGQATSAVQALASGICRCTMTRAGGTWGDWDTHALNDDIQCGLYEELFSDLLDVFALLDATPGVAAATLAEETTVVVLSEMGRTPLFTGGDGKDHWPWTSAMIIGAGVAGGQVVGGHDESFAGSPIDPATGAVHAGGESLSAEMLGATLLALAGIDPGESLPGVPILESVLA